METRRNCDKETWRPGERMKIRTHREVTHPVRQFYKSPLERSTTLVGRCVSLETPCSILDIHPESIQDYHLVHNPPAPRRSRDP